MNQSNKRKTVSENAPETAESTENKRAKIAIDAETVGNDENFWDKKHDANPNMRLKRILFFKDIVTEIHAMLFTPEIVKLPFNIQNACWVSASNILSLICYETAVGLADYPAYNKQCAMGYYYKICESLVQFIRYAPQHTSRLAEFTGFFKNLIRISE